MPTFPITTVEEIIGYTFTDKEILIQAFRSPNGFRKQQADSRWQDSNAPLAYLGDALLRFLVAERLTDKGVVQGSPTQVREFALKTTSLASMFRQLNILEALQEAGYPLKLEGDGVRECGEFFEALTAAVYRDGGLAASQRWLEHSMFRFLPAIIKHASRLNPVQIVNEHCTATYGCPPEFRVQQRPDDKRHNTYTVEAWVAGMRLGIGTETTIKSARYAAALDACKMHRLPRKQKV